MATKSGIKAIRAKQDELYNLIDRLHTIDDQLAWGLWRSARDDQPLEDLRPLVKEAVSIYKDINRLWEQYDSEISAIRAKRVHK